MERTKYLSGFSGPDLDHVVYLFVLINFLGKLIIYRRFYPASLNPDINQALLQLTQDF